MGFKDLCDYCKTIQPQAVRGSQLAAEWSQTRLERVWTQGQLTLMLLVFGLASFRFGRVMVKKALLVLGADRGRVDDR